MPKKQKTVFIAGQSGFLGRVLAKKLQEQGIEVLPTPKKADFTKLADALKATRNADVVVNAAGIITSRVDQLKRPAEVFYTNSLIQFQLLEAAVHNGANHFVSVSSSIAYPNEAPSPLKEEWLIKNIHPDTHHGGSYYALSKWLTIPTLHAFASQYNLNATLAVLPNLYGPEDKFDHPVPPLVPNLILQLHQAAQKNLPVFNAGGGPGRQIDLLYVDDAARFIVEVIKKPLPGFQCVNAGSGKSVTIEQVRKLIRQNVVFKGTIAWSDSEKSAPRHLSNSRSRKEFGWQPHISITEGIARTVSWYLNHVQKTKKSRT